MGNFGMGRNWRIVSHLPNFYLPILFLMKSTYFINELWLVSTSLKTDDQITPQKFSSIQFCHILVPDPYHYYVNCCFSVVSSISKSAACCNNSWCTFTSYSWIAVSSRSGTAKGVYIYIACVCMTYSISSNITLHLSQA